ncbi:hypothetical protein SUGI_0651190 [Cryptomeria japonica]|nr:hypothetical protein SUGI_0651190 [Cryptomeria japonica]
MVKGGLDQTKFSGAPKRHSHGAPRCYRTWKGPSPFSDSNVERHRQGGRSHFESAIGARYGGALDPRTLHLLTARDSTPHGQEKLGPSTLNLAPVSKLFIVSLTKEIEKEVDHNERILSDLGLIGCFKGLWPSLGDLYKWISTHWESIMDDCMQIYPHARGFFVVVFQNEEDRNKVLGCNQWCQEDSNPLMLKPWHPTFNPVSESFDHTPIWIWLPNLPMQF